MRELDLTLPAVPGENDLRTAWLTKHLTARLMDFGPGGPEVVSSLPEVGKVLARFPGHDTGAVVAQLGEMGITLSREGDCAAFYLRPHIRFEDLDHLWGCLFEIL